MTVLVCIFIAAMCYVEICAKETLLNSGGLILGFLEAVADWVSDFI